MGTDGTATPSDQSATSGWVNSAAGALHSPWNSSFPTAFSAAACSSFSIYINKLAEPVNLKFSVTAIAYIPNRASHGLPLQGPCRSTDQA